MKEQELTLQLLVNPDYKELIIEIFRDICRKSSQSLLSVSRFWIFETLKQALLLGFNDFEILKNISPNYIVPILNIISEPQYYNKTNLN